MHSSVFLFPCSTSCLCQVAGVVGSFPPRGHRGEMASTLLGGIEKPAVQDRLDMEDIANRPEWARCKGQQPTRASPTKSQPRPPSKKTPRTGRPWHRYERNKKLLVITRDPLVCASRQDPGRHWCEDSLLIFRSAPPQPSCELGCEKRCRCTKNVFFICPGCQESQRTSKRT